jgi:hypothetical protein
VGEWRHVEIGYLKPNRTHCELCGQLVAGRCWTAEVEGRERVFCSPEHEELFVSYWLPRHGRGAAA